MAGKEKEKKTKPKIDDEKVFKLIREGKTDTNIMNETGIHINTLRNKLIDVMTEDNKVYKIEGINEPRRTVVSTKKGINIPKRSLEGAPFEIIDNDEFSIKWNEEEKIILLVKR